MLQVLSQVVRIPLSVRSEVGAAAAGRAGREGGDAHGLAGDRVRRARALDVCDHIAVAGKAY